MFIVCIRRCVEYMGFKIKKMAIALVSMLVIKDCSSYSIQSECLNEIIQSQAFPDQTFQWFPINYGLYGPAWISPCLPLCPHSWYSHSFHFIPWTFDLLYEPIEPLYSRHLHLLFLLSGKLFLTFPSGLLSHFMYLSYKWPSQREFSCNHFKLALLPPSLSILYPSLFFFAALVTT